MTINHPAKVPQWFYDAFYETRNPSGLSAFWQKVKAHQSSDEQLVIFPCGLCRHAHNGRVIFIPSTNEHAVVDLGCHRHVCEYNCKGEIDGT